jgi:hypothetical protein
MDPLLGMALWPAVLLAIAGLVFAARAAGRAGHPRPGRRGSPSSALGNE